MPLEEILRKQQDISSWDFKTNPTYATLYQNLSTLYATRAISAYRKALRGTKANETSGDSQTPDLLPLDMLGKR